MSKELQIKPVDNLKKILKSDTVQEQFRNAMGKHSDLFVASLIDVFNDGLQDCEPATVVQEALKAAVLKLPISKSLGFAYLVPFKKNYKEGNQWKSKKVATFQIGYRGMIQLAMRSGQLSALNAGPVYEGEYKSYDRLTGVLDISGEKKSDKSVGYFVYMELINGFKKSEYWTKEKIIAHAKEKSQSYGNKKGAWATDFDAMATKTVLRPMLSKYAPMSIDFHAAMIHDNHAQGDIELISEDHKNEYDKVITDLKKEQEKADQETNQPDQGPQETVESESNSLPPFMND